MPLLFSSPTESSPYLDVAREPHPAREGDQTEEEVSARSRRHAEVRQQTSAFWGWEGNNGAAGAAAAFIAAQTDSQANIRATEDPGLQL